MINEPQLTYILELLNALGGLADNFILAGARAIGFNIEQPRYTKDFDFILNVVSLSQSTESVACILTRLGYQPDAKAKYFQFVKSIPNSSEPIRLEFMASDIGIKPKEIRVDVQKDIHAHTCTGAEIALTESEIKPLVGRLPDGTSVKLSIRVAKAHVLLMLKLFAMDDRFKNIRGPREARHDRDEARIHSADIAIIVRANIQYPDFKDLFRAQFGTRQELEQRAFEIIARYFVDLNAPGPQLYREFLQEQYGNIDEEEVKKALREVRLLL